MDLLELMKYRRSIRRYTDRQVAEEDLLKILEAGAYAPNAGGGQRSRFVACQNKALNEAMGKLNLGGFDRSRLMRGFVSKEQPSIIDDPSIRSGFYGAPTVIVIFGLKNFLYSVPDAFCVAENMVLEATELGISSCILARGEETFSNPEGEKILRDWNIPDNMVARCFVILGYVDGPYPASKPRKEGRYIIIK
ncbi:nitroreductase family protein [uncultured Muribaculum sp.]|uniref:nitroreductase family protein n=1 Tax=uncultured Muribaculum sp. TaxID=1918613 RepID=UPI00272A532B|nr:nitroreductase family protein [uncultured Muribaculum sp.]